jgi:hypothetical protein
VVLDRLLRHKQQQLFITYEIVFGTWKVRTEVVSLSSSIYLQILLDRQTIMHRRFPMK